MKIGIVGGGLAGLSAAYDLLDAGHEVTIFEANEYTGGLASGFKDESWEWPLEHFYHHIFTSDDAIIGLVEELGIKDKLFFPRPITSIIYNDKITPFDYPIRWITFPGFNLWDVFRYGSVSAYLRFTKPWRSLEKETADNWLRRYYGTKIYEMIWRPILIGKFGPYYQDVNMAWMWARLHVRSMTLGYFEGGFQTIIDTLTNAVVERGGKIKLNSPVTNIKRENGQLTLTANDETAHFDQCLVTTSPGLMAKMAGGLGDNYLSGLTNLKSMSAVVMTLALNKPLLTEHNTYWLNIPAHSPDKSQNPIPFLALVEHTNYIDKKHYNNEHIIYLGDYVTPDHDYMHLDKGELEKLSCHSFEIAVSTYQLSLHLVL